MSALRQTVYLQLSGVASMPLKMLGSANIQTPWGLARVDGVALDCRWCGPAERKKILWPDPEATQALKVYGWGRLPVYRRRAVLGLPPNWEEVLTHPMHLADLLNLMRRRGWMLRHGVGRLTVAWAWEDPCSITAADLGADESLE